MAADPLRDQLAQALAQHRSWPKHLDVSPIDQDYDDVDAILPVVLRVVSEREHAQREAITQQIERLAEAVRADEFFDTDRGTYLDRADVLAVLVQHKEDA